MVDRDNVAKTERRRHMWKFKAILIGFLGVLIFGGLAQICAAQEDVNMKMHSVSGVISWMDIKLGRLQLEADASRDRRSPSEFKINQHDTRVTDPADKKFLKLEDLQVGQHVTIEFGHIPGEWQRVPIAQNIIANPMSAAPETKGSTTTTTTTTTTETH